MKSESMTLINLSDEIQKILDEAVENHGEIDMEKMENMEMLLAKKVDSVAFWQSSIVSQIENLEKLSSEVIQRIEFYQHKIVRLLDYVDYYFEKNNINEVSGELFCIKKRKPAKKVEIFDESLIPLEFITVPEPRPTIQKAVIAKLLKDGESVNGARLIDGKSTIQIKLK